MGVSVDPPAYPTRVRRTPARLPNRESGPQNQPKAKVAVSVTPGGGASIGGIAAVPPGTGDRKNAPMDPAAINPKRIVPLQRQYAIDVLFTGDPFPSVRRSRIGSRPDQRFHHPLHRDLRGIVGNRVDLPRTAEAFLDLFHAVQPLQGRFPNVVSSHVKRNRGISLPPGLRIAAHGCRKEEKDKDHDEWQDEVSLE